MGKAVSAAAITKATITKQPFGRTDDQDVFLFSLSNDKGDQVQITNFGGIITGWVSADKQGSRSSIVIGYKDFDRYLAKPPFFGALVGRYANRIANGRFTVDGQEYH